MLLSIYHRQTCLKKLDTVSVTGGKLSSCARTSSAEEVVWVEVRVPDDPAVPPAPAVPAHDCRLSFRSRDPFLDRELASLPAGNVVLFSCSMAAALDFLSRLLEAVESESESP